MTVKNRIERFKDTLFHWTFSSVFRLWSLWFMRKVKEVEKMKEKQVKFVRRERGSLMHERIPVDREEEDGTKDE